MKGRKIANRPGLKRKKIRGKDGHTRTYWVAQEEAPAFPSSPRVAPRMSPTVAILGTTLAATTLGGYLGLRGLGKVSSTVDAYDYFWPKKNKEDLEREKSIYDQFQPGDLITRANYFPELGVTYAHYGVYVGRDAKTGEHLVVHSQTAGMDLKSANVGGGEVDPKKIAYVAVTPLSVKAGSGMTRSAWQKATRLSPEGEASPPIPREEVVARARALVGQEVRYELLKTNCEHIARGIVEGRAYSSQVEGLSEVAKVVAGGMEAVVTLGKKPGGFTSEELLPLIDSLRRQARTDSEGGWNGFGLSPEELDRILSRMTGSAAGPMKRKIVQEWLMSFARFKTEDGSLIKPPRIDSRGTIEPGSRQLGVNDSMKGRKIANRPGLAKKKIRGKDGKTRTYWVRQGGGPPLNRAKQSLKTAAAGGGNRAAMAAAVAAGGAMAAYLGLKIGVDNISVSQSDFYWPKEGDPKDEAKIEEIYSGFQPGDMIEKCFTQDLKVSKLAAKHYAIYMGKNEKGEHEIVHATADENGKPVIKRDTIGPKMSPGNSAYQKVETPPPKDKEIEKGYPRSREEILERANFIATNQAHSYDLMRSNCEHIARGIVYGEARSVQGETKNLLAQVGGTLITEFAAKPRWQEGSRPASEIIEEANKFTVEQRKKRAKQDSSEPLKSPKGITGLDELMDQLKVLKGNVKDAVKIRLITNWLLSLAGKDSLKKTDSARAATRLGRAKSNYREICDNGQRQASLSQGRRGGRSSLWREAMDSYREVVENRMDRKGGGAPRPKKGLVKKKIRGKDGVFRTYWVKPGEAVGKGRMPLRQVGPDEVLTMSRFASTIGLAIAGGVAGAIASNATNHALKTVSEELSLGDSPLSPERKKTMEFTPDGKPTAKTYERYEREFQPGDLIRKTFAVAGKDVFHYGIYAGKNPETGEHEIYQVGAPQASGIPSPHIVKSSIHSDMDAAPTTSMFEKVPPEEMGDRKDKGFTREQILERAEGLVGNAFDYKMSRNNCESLARLIVEGEHYTTQGQGAGKLAKKLFDDVSSVIAKASMKEGDVVVTPQQAAEYLESFSKREGEAFSYKDFLAKKEGKKDSQIGEDLIPLSDIIEKGRKEGLFAGSFQKRAEQEVISRYLLLLVTQASLNNKKGGKSK